MLLLFLFCSAFLLVIGFKLCKYILAGGGSLVCQIFMHHHPFPYSLTCVLFYILSDGRWDPAVLIEGVLFRARYLGSTQLVCEGQPTKTTRMMQAEEAVSRIKVL